MELPVQPLARSSVTLATATRRPVIEDPNARPIVFRIPDHEPIGIPAEATHPALQTDSFKELVNKLAWALGTAYREPYRNARVGVRLMAVALASAVIHSDGYPKHLKK